MAEPPTHPDSHGERGAAPGRGSTTGTPRWAKVIGIVVGVLVLLFAVKMLTVGGGFGFDHSRLAGIHG
jgi:hypothetical protein